jgi:hypothetical protein
VELYGRLQIIKLTVLLCVRIYFNIYNPVDLLSQTSNDISPQKTKKVSRGGKGRGLKGARTTSSSSRSRETTLKYRILAS